MNLFRYLIAAIFITIGVVSCSTTETTAPDSEETLSESFEDEETGASFSLQNYRTRLSDAYTSRENVIPDSFDKIRVEEEEYQNIYEGYRIQIFSGQDVAQADTMAANFRVWADTTITGYRPNTYVFFRTPYYRVHVGDFHERERAIEFSNIVKRFYQDAWVVYDRVNPENVPADTVDISVN